MGAGEAVETLSGPEPRKSWQMRKRQERAALKEGLAEWQACTVNYALCWQSLSVLSHFDSWSEACTRQCCKLNKQHVGRINIADFCAGQSLLCGWKVHCASHHRYVVSIIFQQVRGDRHSAAVMFWLMKV